MTAHPLHPEREWQILVPLAFKTDGNGEWIARSWQAGQLRGGLK